MKKKLGKVAIGMSGGVDSSVAAYLLKEQGYDVFGLFMKNWEETDDSGTCTAAQDYEDVASVCETLDIPFYGVNFAKEYWDSVFSDFLQGLKEGFTPNPDILCNREIKFKHLLNKALSLGADFLATGHYAKIENGKLLRAFDTNKDQTYFLYTLQEEQLKQTLFPLGNLPKPEVREIAKKLNLSTASKKDSTGICFIGKRDFGTFINEHIPKTPGFIKTLDGKVIKKHDGLHFFTIGQRRGLGIGGPGEAYFVVDKDQKTNTVFVAQGENHPALFGKALTATDLTWTGSQPTFPLKCTAKIRYRQTDTPCTVNLTDHGQLHVIFDTTQRGITPRQSIVFYQGDTCLGGALIHEKETL